MPIYPQTNRTMLERIIAGDEISWCQFYDQYATVIRTLCRVFSLPEDRADDVVQVVMAKFSRSCNKYLYAPDRAKFRTYFNRIVRASIMDEFRKLKRNNRADDAGFDLERDASAEWERAELEVWREEMQKEALQELASRVSSSNYLAFTMSVLQGKSIQETAKFLGISIPQVYLARTRCAKMLREIIRRCNDADPSLQLAQKGK